MDRRVVTAPLTRCLVMWEEAVVAYFMTLLYYLSEGNEVQSHSNFNDYMRDMAPEQNWVQSQKCFDDSSKCRWVRAVTPGRPHYH